MLDATLSPAEFSALSSRDLSQTTCVVFDILRATTSMTAALANGAQKIIPVAEIADAVAIRERNPEVLLAGERGGRRILAQLTGSIDFDLGNSPREFTKENVDGRTIAMTTTNGTRALYACARARTVLAASFLNMAATLRRVREEQPEHVVLVCAGTEHEAALEDIVAAGAMADALWREEFSANASDAAGIVRTIYLGYGDMLEPLRQSRNGKRLLRIPELADDVAFSAQRDIHDFVARLGQDGVIRKE